MATTDTVTGTYRITVIFKSGKPWRKRNLTFEEAQDIKDEFMTHRMNQIINFYMIPE